MIIRITQSGESEDSMFEEAFEVKIEAIFSGPHYVSL